jgi:hypothetical protein
MLVVIRTHSRAGIRITTSSSTTFTNIALHHLQQPACAQSLINACLTSGNSAAATLAGVFNLWPVATTHSYFASQQLPLHFFEL